MEERDYFLGFSNFSEIGPVRFELLFDFFGSAEKIWEADKNELVNTGLNVNIVDRFCFFRKNFDFGEHQTVLSRKEIKFFCLTDREYPEILKQIPDPPLVLYVKGEFGGLDRAVGIVGTRKMTLYGKKATERIVGGLVREKIIIISGMARGIDAVAHRTALENGGRTIAVLGTGVDVIYPWENRDLYYKIIRSGAVVSEVAPGSTVLKGAFRLRNRVISGLSCGIVVVEGAKESGSLITARYALEQGREVFAVPGPITSKMSEGPSYLISQGAKLATKAEDILEEI